MRKEVHRQIILTECSVCYNRDGDQSPRAWESKAIRESFLEMVTLGLEYRFF